MRCISFWGRIIHEILLLVDVDVLNRNIDLYNYVMYVLLHENNVENNDVVLVETFVHRGYNHVVAC